MSETSNITNTSSSLEQLKGIFDQYQKSHEKNTRAPKVDLLKKIFIPSEKKEIFRILPVSYGNKIIEEAHFHVFPVPSEKKPDGTYKMQYAKVYCLAKNGDKQPKLDPEGNPILDKQGKPVMVEPYCPACEKAKEIKARANSGIYKKDKNEWTEEEKAIAENNKKIFKESGNFESKKFYIIKGIDKGNPKDGVKFWRFKHNFSQQGTHDILIPQLQEFMDEYGDFTDVNKGSDLNIFMTDTKTPSGLPYKKVTSIVAKPPSQLHEDETVVKSWVEDKTTWKDVWKAKASAKLTPEQYMERAMYGKSPFWSDLEKKWIFPDPADMEFEAKANVKDRDLSGDDSNQEQTSSKVVSSQNIGDVQTEQPSYKSEPQTVTQNSTNIDVDNFDPDSDDLPF